VLLPPSEGKAAGGCASRTPDGFGPQLALARSALAHALGKTLRGVSRANLEKLVNARGERALAARTALEQYLGGTAPHLVAWRRYDGVVWRHLDPATLSDDQRARVLVPSALYGVNCANDVIADYRLKMSVRLKGIGPVAPFWRDALTETVIGHVAGREVVDLLPREHAAAVDFDLLGVATTLVRVSFVDQHRARAVGHAAKAAKGIVARTVLEGGVASLRDFEWAGWRAHANDQGFVVVAP
jgi:hypothetical protein